MRKKLFNTLLIVLSPYLCATPYLCAMHATPYLCATQPAEPAQNPSIARKITFEHIFKDGLLLREGKTQENNKGFKPDTPYTISILTYAEPGVFACCCAIATYVLITPAVCVYSIFRIIYEIPSFLYEIILLLILWLGGVSQSQEFTLSILSIKDLWLMIIYGIWDIVRYKSIVTFGSIAAFKNQAVNFHQYPLEDETWSRIYFSTPTLSMVRNNFVIYLPWIEGTPDELLSSDQQGGQ